MTFLYYVVYKGIHEYTRVYKGIFRTLYKGIQGFIGYSQDIIQGYTRDRSLYLTSVVPSVPTGLLSMEADGAPSTPPATVSSPFLRVFKAIATRTRGKSKQMLKSLKIEPGNSRSESRALANWATSAPIYDIRCGGYHDVLAGYTMGIQGFIGYSQDIISSLT